MENDNRPKLYIKNEEWWPPPQYIPDEIHDRIINFCKALAPHFVKRRGKPNLLPFQCKILRQIWRDDNIVIVNADKGLGPCAVLYKQYVNDALVHLKDEKTYVQLPNDEAAAAAINTESLIRNWCRKHVTRGLTKNDVLYIKQSLNENEDPFWILLPDVQNPQTRPHHETSLFRLL
jgi:hypothetical protein